MKDIEIYNDSFQNYKSYQIPKAQLILTDVPYNLGNNAYASNPTWYEGGDNKNGESEKAGKKFFSDIEYNILTVDIQNPIMDAPKPMNTEKNP